MSLTIKGHDSITIAAPADDVWTINGDRFVEIGAWSRSVRSSRPLAGNGPEGAPSAGRICDVAGFGEVEEVLTAFDPSTRSFGLTVESGLPFFVKRSEFESRVDAVTPTTSRFELWQVMEVSWFPGAMLQPFLRRKIQATVEVVMTDLKHLAEHGTPHPDKVAQLAATRR